MKYLIFFLLPITGWAINRTLWIDAPTSVYAGQSITVSTYASTDATDGEQIVFFHGEYSTDGGATWNGAFYPVGLGASSTQNFYVTAGAAGSTIVLRSRAAFREGESGDVDYNGDWLDWGGSWDGWQTPPAVYSYISVVAPPNSAPQIGYVQNPSSAAINQPFAVQSAGWDGDGNLAGVHLWREWVPFAFSGGGNGYESYTDANTTSGPAAGSIAFQTQAVDGAGAESAMIFHNVYIYNNPPHSPSLSASGTGVTWNNSAQRYEMWLKDEEDSAKPGLVTLTGNVKDSDGNLTLHRIWKAPNGVIDWDHPITSITPSNGANSTAVITNYEPLEIGRLDFHTNAQDSSGAWSNGASITVWVNGLINGSTFISQSINGVSNPTSVSLGNNQSLPVLITFKNSGTKPWTSNATPHQLASTIVNSDVTWSAQRVGLPAQTIPAEPLPGNTATFSFNLVGPVKPGTYQFQWQMIEDQIQWFGPLTPAVTVTVLDTLAPTSPGTLSSPSKTHNSISLAWGASTDNSGATKYAIYRNGGAIPIANNLSAPSYVDTGLVASTAYSYTVKAYDAAGNYSSASNQLNVTTLVDPWLDSDSDGVPDVAESALGTNPAVVRQNDSGNSNQLNVHQPRGS
jgi:hypothetical protein